MIPQVADRTLTICEISIAIKHALLGNTLWRQTSTVLYRAQKVKIGEKKTPNLFFSLYASFQLAIRYYLDWCPLCNRPDSGSGS